MLESGDLLLICYRRLFSNDENRFFLGTVDDYQAGIVKITGHSFLRDSVTGQMAEKSDLATKILSISSGTLIVYQLPATLALHNLRFEQKMMKLTLLDDQGFALDLTEKTYRQN
ncbi:hypothetical protein WG68_07875 [Arsukibacterium ikkense]|uniref:Uncharacterized protein n=1 Tax=Arsukibacterium ikkense TaxID=336831 RepID=A0A0M2V8D2_9GAMM|nr:hypothetical protein [Arsukibacterium ikkense]KKO45920.1 hypothetical protein WG68_07875 [Arsukibacterium ikkense]